MPTLKTNLEGYFNGRRTLRAGTVVQVSGEDRGNEGEVLLQVENAMPPERFWADRAAYRRAISEQVPEFESGE